MRSWTATIAALIGVGLFLVSCAAPRASNDADRMGRTVIDAVQRNDWYVLDRTMAKSMAGDPTHAATIDHVRALFPPEPPWSIKLLTSDSSERSGKSTSGPEVAHLSYLYAFAQKRLVLDLTVEHHGWRRVYEPPLLKAGEVPAATLPDVVEETEPAKPADGALPYKVARVYRLVDIHAVPVDAQAEARNAFFGPPKTTLQWGFLAATVGSPLLMLIAAISALRARGLKLKWAWVAASFVGVGSAWMDWTSAHHGYAPLSATLLGIGLSKGPSPLSPWMLTFAPPLGAALVLVGLAVRRRPRDPA